MTALVSRKSQEQRLTKQGSKRVRQHRGYKLPPDLIKRLGHYVVDHPTVEKSEVVEKALDKFLTDEGY